MHSLESLIPSFDPAQYSFWVLIPQLETEDENLRYYYDYSTSIEEYARVFEELGCEWDWLPVSIRSIDSIVAEIRNHSDGRRPVAINLCDGDGINGVPGISVIRALREARIPYTGADEAFYATTTSKIVMKQAFDAAGVRTPAWSVLMPDENMTDGHFDRIGRPIIVKPAVSGGSMGVSLKSVVHDNGQLHACYETLQSGYRGWDLITGGVIAERFIAGREFTVFIVGSASDAGERTVYPSVERVFHPSLLPHERILSFDRRWETYDEESPMPDGGFVYTYHPTPASIHTRLSGLAVDAYLAVQGTGYARIDIRMDTLTGDLYVLEVNAQCGLSEDENSTSIGAMLRLAGKSFTLLTAEIIADALRRNRRQSA